MRLSDCAHAQADLRLCCSHMAKTGFSHDVAQIMLNSIKLISIIACTCK